VSVSASTTELNTAKLCSWKKGDKLQHLIFWK